LGIKLEFKMEETKTTEPTVEEIPTYEPPTKKRRVPTEKQLEALKKGRELRLANKQAKKTEVTPEPVAEIPKAPKKSKGKKKAEPVTEDTQDWESAEEPSEVPQLKRERAEFYDGDQEEESQGTEEEEEPQVEEPDRNKKGHNRVRNYISRHLPNIPREVKHLFL